MAHILYDYNWNFRYVKDYMLRQDPLAQNASKELDMFWMHDLWISLFLAFSVICTVSIIHKRIADNIRANLLKIRKYSQVTIL